MSNIGVNEYHEGNIVKFIKFSRSQRALSIRTIAGAFKEIEKSRLKNETTLTVDEVSNLLVELWDYVKEEIDTELSYQTHTYVLLLRQLFLQAEHSYLKLGADISELQNKDLLEKVRNFENEQFQMSKVRAPKLEPVNDSGATMLLREKIDELESENRSYREKIGYLEKKLAEFNRGGGRSGAAAAYPDHSDTISNLESKMNQLRSDLKNSSSAKERELESEMGSIKSRFMEIQEQLRMTERELEKKFNQTNAYKNMKLMLDKKNEQIKDLRRRLNRYEPIDD
jgi:leucine zipper transcription factor-like protein 1